VGMTFAEKQSTVEHIGQLQIGLSALSDAAERGHQSLYVCIVLRTRGDKDRASSPDNMSGVPATENL
jgi:hypothetical protein